MRNIWVGNWGQFDIPSDVPFKGNTRKNGWFDRRRKITPMLKQYFDWMDILMSYKKPVLTWAEWKLRLELK
jgi:hypothetical protein